jgi:circadian clock protein KaiC
MAHSNQIREFRLTNRGVQLTDIYLGPAGVLTGAARVAQEVKEKAEAVARQHELEHKQRELERKRQVLEAQVATLRAEFEEEAEELTKTIAQEQLREQSLVEQRASMASLRQADDTASLATLSRKSQRSTVKSNGQGKLR